MSENPVQIPVFTPPAHVPLPLDLTNLQRQKLSRILEAKNSQYDPEWQMLRQPLGKPLYHTKLRGDLQIHSTRSAFEYAVELLDWGGHEELERAEAVLRTTLAMQDMDPDSSSFGIWPWFGEEPVSEMAPPDWNWADFCGMRLLQVARSHRQRLSPDLAVALDAAIARACFSIKRRSMGYDYTNIALMGIYVTLVAGETYDCKEMTAWAMGRLRGFTLYTRAAGGFIEYNSPNYTTVALDEIGRMRAHVQSEEAKPYIEELYHAAWSELARHFHAPTRQWAGPHSRSYQTLLKPETLRLIQEATEGAIDFGAEGDLQSFLAYRVPLPCPADLWPYLRGEHLPRREGFVRRIRPAGVDNGRVPTDAPEPPPIEAETYLHEKLTFGSVKRGSFWDQCRSQLAYFGKAERPQWFRPRLIRNGIEFAAGQLFTAQRDTLAVAALTFATDGGTNHCSLDRLQDATFSASDLRLRFEFGGLEPGCIRLQGGPTRVARIELDGLTVQLQLLDAVLGEITPAWESAENDTGSFVDAVFYEGGECNFVLREMEQAWAAWAVRFDTGEVMELQPELKVDRGLATVACDGLSVSVPVKPVSLGELTEMVVF